MDSDPPRNFFRGAWDAYADDNPLFREWAEYNKITVYRHVGKTATRRPPCPPACHPNSCVVNQIRDKIYRQDRKPAIMANSTRIYTGPLAS